MPKTLKEFIQRRKQAEKNVALADADVKKMGKASKALMDALDKQGAMKPTPKQAEKLRAIAAMSSILLAKIEQAETDLRDAPGTG